MHVPGCGFTCEPFFYIVLTSSDSQYAQRIIAITVEGRERSSQVRTGLNEFGFGQIERRVNVTVPFWNGKSDQIIYGARKAQQICTVPVGQARRTSQTRREADLGEISRKESPFA